MGRGWEVFIITKITGDPSDPEGTENDKGQRKGDRQAGTEEEEEDKDEKDGMNTMRERGDDWLCVGVSSLLCWSF